MMATHLPYPQEPVSDMAWHDGPVGVDGKSVRGHPTPP